MNKDHIDYSLYGAIYNSIIIKYSIRKIIANENAVIVFFEDGQKTVVKKMDSDANDIYSAVAQAVMKKIYGSTNAFHKFVDKLYEKR